MDVIIPGSLTVGRQYPLVLSIQWDNLMEQAAEAFIHMAVRMEMPKIPFLESCMLKNNFQELRRLVLDNPVNDVRNDT